MKIIKEWSQDQFKNFRVRISHNEREWAIRLYLVQTWNTSPFADKKLPKWDCMIHSDDLRACRVLTVVENYTDDAMEYIQMLTLKKVVLEIPNINF